MCWLPSSLAVLELVLAQNASLTTEARRHRMVPRDHNDGFMALYDVGSLRLLALRFLYNRLALFIHCDNHLSSMTLPWQLLSVIKVELFHQILPVII